ncbi:FAD-dependent monooxygenase [Psychrobacter fjordensis]
MLVVGSGQPGMRMSEYLSKLGIEHIVLEKNRIAKV